MKRKRIFVAIDGSNFYHKLKKLGFKNLAKFDYKSFVNRLAKNNKQVCFGRNKIIESCFYIGQIREELGNKKSKQLKRDQDRLLARLKNLGISVKTGYILKSDGKYHEKGVDVQIAVDICMKAVGNNYDRLVLISSDTDLIPAIKAARGLGKEIEYVGFDDNPSFALIRFSNSRTLLKKEDLLPYVKK